RLVATLIADGMVPRRVVHLWNVDPIAPGDHRFEDVEARSFGSVLALVQALVRHGVTSPIDLLVANTGSERVDEVDRVDATRGLCAGLTLVVPQECQSFRCGTVDVAVAADLDVAALGTQLAGEV